MKEIIITKNNAGGRLDKIIFRYLDKASPGFVYKMLRKKNITLNDKRAEGSAIVNEGDSIKLYLSDETVARFKSGESFRAAKAGRRASGAGEGAGTDMHGAEIAYEDDNVIALNKPAGLLSQKVSKRDISLNDIVLQLVPGDEIFKPGISNRLDRNTSGLILAGKNLAAARLLNHAVKQRSVAKKYICVACGSFEISGRKSARLLKDGVTNKVTVSESMEEGADIITEFRPVRYFDTDGFRLTLLEVELITGKSHQIRAHLAYFGHPILGDAKYGEEGTNAYFKAKLGLNAQLLHAYRVEFNDMEGALEYLNGKKITAAPPRIWNKMLGEGGYGDLELQGPSGLQA